MDTYKEDIAVLQKQVQELESWARYTSEIIKQIYASRTDIRPDVTVMHHLTYRPVPR